jgi:hypothetical protein
MEKNHSAALRDYTSAIKAGSSRAYFRRVEVYQALGMDDLAKKDQERIDLYGYDDVPWSSAKLIGQSTKPQHKTKVGQDRSQLLNR